MCRKTRTQLGTENGAGTLTRKTRTQPGAEDGAGPVLVGETKEKSGTTTGVRPRLHRLMPRLETNVRGP